MTQVIDSFSDDYEFLSNFYLVEVEFEGDVYPSTEHAYQAAKSLNPEVRKTVRQACSKGGVPDCGRAKRMGQKLTLRKDWESIKLKVMLELLRKKFAHPELKEKLLATGKAKLVEGNWWKDTFWGVCQGRGANHLGRLLMQVRTELRESQNQFQPIEDGEVPVI